MKIIYLFGHYHSDYLSSLNQWIIEGVHSSFCLRHCPIVRARIVFYICPTVLSCVSQNNLRQSRKSFSSHGMIMEWSSTCKMHTRPFISNVFNSCFNFSCFYGKKFFYKTHHWSRSHQPYSSSFFDPRLTFMAPKPICIGYMYRARFDTWTLFERN